jgi:hypothetical protein
MLLFHLDYFGCRTDSAVSMWFFIGELSDCLGTGDVGLYAVGFVFAHTTYNILRHTYMNCNMTLVLACYVIVITWIFKSLIFMYVNSKVLLQCGTPLKTVLHDRNVSRL